MRARAARPTLNRARPSHGCRMSMQIFFDTRNAVHPVPLSDGAYAEHLEEMRARTDSVKDSGPFSRQKFD